MGGWELVETYSEGEVPGLSHPVLARSDVVQVPEEDDEHQAGHQVAHPDIHQCHVVRAVTNILVLPVVSRHVTSRHEILSHLITGLLTLDQFIPPEPDVSLNHIMMKPKVKPRLGTSEMAILVPRLQAK